MSGHGLYGKTRGRGEIPRGGSSKLVCGAALLDGAAKQAVGGADTTTVGWQGALWDELGLWKPSDGFAHDFSPPSQIDLQVNGAGISYPGYPQLGPVGFLQLTEQTGGTGSVWHRSQVYVGGSWQSDFLFDVVNAGGLRPTGGDGFTFAIHRAPAGLAQLGSGGGDLGYTGIDNSLVVEFDTFDNHPSAGDTSDLSSSELAVHSNGTGTNAATAATNLGSVNLLGLGLALQDEALHRARIRYTPGTLEVFIDDMTTPRLSVTVNLATLLSLGDGGRAWVGFTGSIGAAWQTTRIYEWTFSGGPLSQERLYAPRRGRYRLVAQLCESDLNSNLNEQRFADLRRYAADGTLLESVARQNALHPIIGPRYCLYGLTEANAGDFFRLEYYEPTFPRLLDSGSIYCELVK